MPSSLDKVVINGQISNTATVSTCAVPPTIIALDPSRCKKDATEAAIAAGEATIYYEKAYDSTDAGGAELDLIQKSDMPYEIIIGPNSDSPMSIRKQQRHQQHDMTTRTNKPEKVMKIFVLRPAEASRRGFITNDN